MNTSLKLPKLFEIRHLYSDHTGKAGKEALENACRLVQAGQFDAAHRVLISLSTPGPWRVSRSFVYRYHLWQQLLWLGRRLGRDAPALDPDDQVAQMAANWLQNSTQPESGGHLLGGRPSAPTWSATDLTRIAATVKPDRFGDVFNNFHPQAKAELKRRIDARRPWTGTVHPREPGEPDDHGAIADMIERCSLYAFPRDGHLSCFEVGFSAAMLDVFDGRHEAAVVRLARLLPKLKLEDVPPNWRFAPYADFLATGALGNALGIDAAGTAAYLEAFSSRSPFTVSAPKPRLLKVVLTAWAKRTKEDGIDAAALLETVDAGVPDCKALRARAKKGQPLNGPATEDALVALEARIGMALPPSYRDFLQACDGLVVPSFVSLLPAAQVDWLHVLDPDTVSGWTESNGNDDLASDEQYDVYGADQDCIHMRTPHLHQALQISSNCDGDVLLLVPAVRFGAEWEAWFLGAKNPGAYRFRSFRALLEQQVLADQ